MSVRDVVQAAAGALGGAGAYVEDVFSTYLFTGTGTTTDITNGIDLAGEGGLLWIKDRDSGAKGHALFDTERGGQYKLQTQSTGAQTSYNNIVFNSDGFTNDTLGDNNGSGTKYTSWTWRKAEKFFDVVTWTGDGVNPRNITHNLGSIPGCIIIKCTSDTGDWFVYHRTLGNTKSLNLNQTGAAQTGTTIWGSTTPTDTVFTVGNINANTNGRTYVAYLFAHDAGGFGDDGEQNVISCGSFVSGSPGFVTLGYEPQWLLIKRSDSATYGNWYLIDAMRGLTGSGSGNSTFSYANTANTDFVSGINVHATATGFTESLFTGGTYIYIAIRRGPMKTPESGTEVFNALARTGTGAAVTTSATFAPDLMIVTDRAKSLYAATDVFNRLRANKFLITNGTQAEGTRTQFLGFDAMTGVRLDADTSGFINFSSKNYIDWYFKRAPGFFDVVAYEGTGVARTLNHNLGVAPELVIIKSRSNANGWVVGSSLSPNVEDYMWLHLTSAWLPGSFWNNTRPTATEFSVSTGAAVNGSGLNFIAYLFSSLDGVSKVGTYAGTGGTVNVDCGFSAGARFILIKRTDSTGDWYVWDSERGIVAGNDPYLLLNSTAAEVTSTDYIDPLSSGFTVTSSAPAALNASGGTYIFLAIA